MPGRVHGDINWDCPRVDTWSSSGLKTFGIETRQIIRDLQSPQMPSADKQLLESEADAVCQTPMYVAAVCNIDCACARLAVELSAA